jgi:hypothetical protein
MQCLAFGLMAALLLDATVVRMFLVPSVMKLLGDDCWWAPLWMKRLQNRLGLGEIHLPDERKVPSAQVRAAARPAATTRPPVTPVPRPPHDPTHPGTDSASRPARPSTPPPPAGPEPRPEIRRPAPDAPPSAAGTSRMPGPGRPEPKEAPTTRFSAQPSVAPVPGRPPAPPMGAPRGEDREIESWLSDLRGGKAAPQQPSADETRALQVPPRDKPSGPPPNAPDDATTAIPTPPREDKDADPATEKMNAHGEKPRPRRGGGLSAADLLRREGRM